MSDIGIFLFRKGVNYTINGRSCVIKLADKLWNFTNIIKLKINKDEYHKNYRVPQRIDSTEQ